MAEQFFSERNLQGLAGHVFMPRPRVKEWERRLLRRDSVALLLGVQASAGQEYSMFKSHVYIRPKNFTGELSRFVNLLWALVLREFKGRYRRSLLGPAWAILQPVLYMVIFTFLRGALEIPSDGVPYVIFTYSALVPWTFFSNAVMRCGPSVASNAPVLKKVAISREVFPLAGVVTSFIDFIIASIILAGMIVWFRLGLGMALFWLPFLVGLTAFLAFGVGLAVAAIGTYKLDIIFAVPFLMQFWLLATPIMYPLSKVPDRWRFLYSLNPMVGIIEGFRTVIVKGVTPDLSLLLVSAVGAVLFWILAWSFFRYTSQYFADVL